MTNTISKPTSTTSTTTAILTFLVLLSSSTTTTSASYFNFNNAAPANTKLNSIFASSSSSKSNSNSIFSNVFGKGLLASNAGTAANTCNKDVSFLFQLVTACGMDITMFKDTKTPKPPLNDYQNNCLCSNSIFDTLNKIDADCSGSSSVVGTEPGNLNG
ncbi:hypothetical protein HDU76_010429, partial [Blyttiomyces sp. JEL0837]